MKRMRGYSNLGGRGEAMDEAARDARLRALAERLRPRGRARLRLGEDCARALRRTLREAAAMEDAGDDALNRLRADAGRVEACLREAEAASGARTPASEEGAPRVLALARELVDGGERLLTKELLLRKLALFDSARSLEMRELQLVPAALRIALCEALRDAGRDVLRVAKARAAADEWVRAGGKGRGRGDCDEAFFERALQLSLELERPELLAWIERAIDRCGQRREWLVERAHRIAADNCLRLDNLMKLKHLLDGLNWRECFDALCAAEQELRDDPARIYARMDSDSRALVRREVEALARRARVEEIVVVRHALRLARAAKREGDAAEVAGSPASGENSEQERSQAPDMGKGPEPERLEALVSCDPRASVCWYLVEDEGRAALCRELGARGPRRMLPDPSGRGSAALVCALTAACLALILWGIGEPWLMVWALPLAWGAAWRLLGRFYPKFVRPGKLLKLRLESVPAEARTLVALPVLLSGEGRAREMVARLEALGCLERDPNVDFLLLGDFRDGAAPREPEDESILRAAREGVAELNEAAGREKYFYLHRERRLREVDGRWMGENRKRGALMALNRLLLGVEGAASAFGAEGGCAARLAGRYRYVVTLDADTEYLPGTIQRLVGAMLHPLNRRREEGGSLRGYAVLQPDMRLTAEASENLYVELTAGRGGMDGYPTSVSDFYQDFTGHGCFAGKGIYDVRAFAEATEGALDDENILSHDLIEGVLAGAGVANDLRFYDGCPGELGAELKRLHRWTRGDWQLLPVLFSKLRLGAADRMKLAGNLLRSLHAPALLGLLVQAVWMDAPGAFALGLALAFLEPVLNLPFSLFGEGRRRWRAALLQLATLPATALCQLDAILRTLWRLAVTHKHLMDWVTAADASGSGARTKLPGRIAALLVLPGMLRSQWIVPALGIAMLFWVGAGWADDLSRQRAGARAPLKGGQAALLMELARRTWRFFETCVPLDGPGLPPDNLQLDPDLGPAMRTSPTNVGLYLMSCLAARELGLISDADMRARMAATTSTLEGLEKWSGQLYNWYDIETLAPLRPRYVSAVDSGNLAGALLLCAHALRAGDPALSKRLRALAEGMDLAALYDEERELFRIGMDAESGRLSESHYDLYASEARILSFAAMMLGQVPVKHWARLNRASVRVGNRSALLSWSGTMFEYLMPELLLRGPANTLAGRSREGVAAWQIRHGKRNRRPWGVSESGFYAFDGQLNYQYRAFGLRELALSGDAEAGVVAPYASALALCCEPGAAAENLRRMCALGWSGELGLYEAADYARSEGTGGPHIVRSHMAHHQGMALCATCNALRGDALSRTFLDIPEARALRLLLQEKPGALPPRRGGHRPAPEPRASHRPEINYSRGGSRSSAADAHLLRGAGTTALVTARGAIFAWSEGLQLNRFSGDLTDPHQGMFVHLTDADTGARAVFGRSGRASFDAGLARFREEFAGLEAELKICISPEDGALYQIVELENPGDEARALEVTGCLAVALAPERDMRAHPTFQNLFVEGERLSPRALMLRRRPRMLGEELPRLIYLASGGEDPRGEMRLDALIGREGSLGLPGGLEREFGDGEGALLNPCAALRVRVTLAPKSSARLHFALLLAPAEEAENHALPLARAEEAANRGSDVHVQSSAQGEQSARKLPSTRAEEATTYDSDSHAQGPAQGEQGARELPLARVEEAANPASHANHGTDARIQSPTQGEQGARELSPAIQARVARSMSEDAPDRALRLALAEEATSPSSRTSHGSDSDAQSLIQEDKGERELSPAIHARVARAMGENAPDRALQSALTEEAANRGSDARSQSPAPEEDAANRGSDARFQSPAQRKQGAREMPLARVEEAATYDSDSHIQGPAQGEQGSRELSPAIRARVARAMGEDAADRALRLARAQARTVLMHAGLDGARFALYQRAAALLFDPKLRIDEGGGAEAREPVDRRALWSAGISGELPVLLVELGEGGDLSCAREGVRLHAFYRSMGVQVDFVLLDGRSGDYRRNAGGELGGLIAASHLGGMLDIPGGAHIRERGGLEEEALEALRRVAELRLGPAGSPLGQIRTVLDGLKLRAGEEYRPMPAGKLARPEDLLCDNGWGGFRASAPDAGFARSDASPDTNLDPDKQALRAEHPTNREGLPGDAADEPGAKMVSGDGSELHASKEESCVELLKGQGRFICREGLPGAALRDPGVGMKSRGGAKLHTSEDEESHAELFKSRECFIRRAGLPGDGTELHAAGGPGAEMKLGDGAELHTSGDPDAEMASGDGAELRDLEDEESCADWASGARGGGFLGEYHIPLRGGRVPPAPWCNVIASERAGAVISERGGGFAWAGNSRSGRLTPFANDSLREGWGWMFYLVDARERRYLRLLPGDAPMTDFDVRFSPGLCAWAGRTGELAFELRAWAVGDGVLFEVELNNGGRSARSLSLLGFADWLMGTDAADAALLRTWSRFGACFAAGAAEGVGCFACDDPAAAPGCDRRTLLSGGDAMRPRGLDHIAAANGGWTLRAPVQLRAGESRRWRFLLGHAGSVAEAYALVRDFRAGAELPGGTDWPALLDALRIETPDPALNFLSNGFLQAQALDSRVRGRTGMYQPGGAYGFRDQLQDVIALIHWQPERARRHLLRCAARQFADGDVLHWWHEPATGVRTRVSDDLLFLPWAAAKYVALTGDASVLADRAPYLEDVAIPEGAEDVYAEMRLSPLCESLHAHCMRAFRHAARFGPDGLCLMGGGDWNDGMNRVGGESVWLSEFLAAVAADYAGIAPVEGDRAWLTALSERLCAALEAHAWDGEWYLRAFAEDGAKLGSRDSDACRIDLISQAWAVLAGLDGARCRSAMDAAWERLVDEKLGIVKLLDPPFDAARGGFDPGYIAAYPPGIRENGAQYTHAAIWYLCAAIHQGDAKRAHALVRMLLPLNRARDAREAEVYCVEPYVMAADVYANPDFAGRGGWTWYTGSAGWMLQAILMLLGYERHGPRVRLRALLGDWPEASVTLRWGSSRYRLTCRPDVKQITLDGKAIEGEFIEMHDDHTPHLALFPTGRAGSHLPGGGRRGRRPVPCGV